MPGSKRGDGFAGLLTGLPAALPDAADEGATPAPPSAAHRVPSSADQAVPRTQADMEVFRGRRRQEAPAPARRVPQTVRLRPEVAAELTEAWEQEILDGNPRLTYVAYASDLIAEGLAARKRRRARS